ncbi:MAG: hypothetical protein LUQ67_01245, partial [Methanomicrobiales archaeon]|nr:hypothetical protein [Methanomicrobiales archaeon]
MEISQSLQLLGENIEERIHPVILHIITFLIPVNIYIIGDRLGAGIQWPLFRYQETYLGENLISIFMDAGYVVQRILYGKTAFSIILWILGVILLVVPLLIALWEEVKSSTTSFSRIRGYLLLSGALLFLLSILIQYGPLLHGPAGIAIPIGIP